MGLDELLICYNFLPLMADHALDFPTTFYESHGLKRMHDMDTLDPGNVRTGDVIFVKTDYIVNNHFKDNVFDNINLANWFVMVTGNSAYQLGRDGGDAYLAMLNHPKVKKWYCTHPPQTNSNKIVPLPIGFEEPGRMGGTQQVLIDCLNKRLPAAEKDNKVFLPHHTVSTNASRNSSIRHLSEVSNVFVQEEKQDFVDYLRSLREHKYVICLEGAGPDTHRNYETLLAGSVPILKNSTIRNLFERHALPGIFVDSWDEITDSFIEGLSFSNYDFSNVASFLRAQTHVSEIRSEK